MMNPCNQIKGRKKLEVSAQTKADKYKTSIFLINYRKIFKILIIKEGEGVDR